MTNIRFLIFTFLPLTALLLSFFSSATVTVELDKQLLSELTPQELAYISEHKVLKVQSEDNYPPFNYAVNGKPSGFSIDFIKLLSAKLGMQVQFEQNKSWGDYVEMLQNKQLDLMLNIMENPRRREFANFTTDYAQTFIMAVTRKDNTQVVQAKSSLDNKRIVTVKGYAGFHIIKEILPKAQFVFADDPLDALTFVASKRADVFFANGVLANYYIQKYFVTGLSIQPVPKELSFPRQHLRMATHKDNQILLGIIQKALNSIDEQQLIALRQKWFGAANFGFDDSVQLSNSQKIWLLRNRDISITLPSPGLPLGEYSNNLYRGILSDFVRHFDNVLGTNWLTNNQAKVDRADLTIANPHDRHLMRHYDFSQPILSMPIVVLTANPARMFVGGLDNLDGTKTGIVSGAAYFQPVKEKYPKLKLQPYSTMNDAMWAVNNGEVDVLLCPLAHCTYLINELGANNLRVVGQTEFFDNYSFAVKKSLPKLLTIVENALAAIEPERRNAIFKRWNSREEVLVKTDYTKVKYLLLGALLITLVIVFWNRNIAKYAKSVANAHEELKQTQSQLVQAEKMASLGTLTAGVAHEINNPTNFVHVGVQNLEVDLERVQRYIFDLAGENADEEIVNAIQGQFKPLFDHLHTIQDGTARIKTIVKDLRSFSRLDSPETQWVDIRDCLRSTINLVRTKYIETAEIETHFEEVPQLGCHPAQLNQVLMNVIVNACHAIMVKQLDESSNKPGKIIISCRQLEHEIIIEVTDNGCGMSEQTKNRLFEPFYTTKAVGEGTGLGMAISFGIIKEHGGYMEVESTLGEGTELRIHLPLNCVNAAATS